MKFQFDLLPQEYKSLKRDILGFVLAFFAVTTCVSFAFVRWGRNNLDLIKAQKEIEDLKTELRTQYERTKSLQPPAAEIAAWNSRVEFINKNLDTPGTSWVDFLFAIEATVPENIYIKSLNPLNFSNPNQNFTLVGEANSIGEVLTFVEHLQKSKKFQNIFLLQNSNVLVNGKPLVQFTLSFVFQDKP